MSTSQAEAEKKKINLLFGLDAQVSHLCEIMRHLRLVFSLSYDVRKSRPSTPKNHRGETAILRRRRGFTGKYLDYIVHHRGQE
ncbi:hypothetical protein Plhal304r1_c043g0122741 [Plasmopara halstedii]